MASAAGAFVVSCLTGCIYPWRGEPPCFPPDYGVSPSTAKIGDTVTVSAADADCDPRYGHNAIVQVTLADASGQEVMKATGPMNDAGGFTFRFEVPPQAVPGTAAVEAVPYAVDWCDDTGRNNRVAGSQAQLERASCAARAETLIIVP